MSSIPNSQGVMFDYKSAQKIALAVRAVLRNPGDRSDQSPGVPLIYQPFWASLLAESNSSAGSYNWSGQNLIGGALSAGSMSDASFSAKEANGISGIAPGTFVKLEYGGQNANGPSYTFSVTGTDNGCLVRMNTSSGSGVYTGNILTGKATGYSAGAYLGLTLGPACEVYNDTERASPGAQIYIDTSNKPQVPGRIMGTNAVTGKLMVSIFAVSAGC